MNNNSNQSEKEEEAKPSQMNLAGFKANSNFLKFRPITIKIPTKREHEEFLDVSEPNIGRQTPYSQMRDIVINSSDGNSTDSSPRGYPVIPSEDNTNQNGSNGDSEDDDNLSIGPSAPKKLSLSPHKEVFNEPRGLKRGANDYDDGIEYERARSMKRIPGITFRPDQIYFGIYGRKGNADLLEDSVTKKIDRIILSVFVKIIEFCNDGRTDGSESIELVYKRTYEGDKVLDILERKRFFITVSDDDEEMKVYTTPLEIDLQIPATLADDLPDDASDELNENQVFAYNKLFSTFVREILHQWGGMESDTGVMAQDQDFLRGGDWKFGLHDFIDENTRCIIRETMQIKKRITGVFRMKTDERSNTFDFFSNITICRAIVVKNNKYVSSVTPHNHNFYMRQPEFNSWDTIFLLATTGQLVFFSKKRILKLHSCDPDKVLNY